MPRPFPELWKRYPRAGQALEQAEQAMLRPLFLHWRRKHLREYLAGRRASGKRAGLHMGCAFSPLEGWYNCDLNTLSRAVNYIDATRPLPFDDASFDFVFSEHFIEHLSLEQGTAFFREALRVLKPGGVLRTATPDLQFARELCEGGTPAHRRYVEWAAKTFLPGQPASYATVVNHLFRGWGHQFIYDARFLEQVLRELGFREFRECAPGESPVAELRGLERHGQSVPPEFNELETFVLEAVK